MVEVRDMIEVVVMVVDVRVDSGCVNSGGDGNGGGNGGDSSGHENRNRDIYDTGGGRGGSSRGGGGGDEDDGGNGGSESGDGDARGGSRICDDDKNVLAQSLNNLCPSRSKG